MSARELGFDLAWRRQPVRSAASRSPMPPFRPTEITEREIQDIAAYLRYSSSGNR